MIPILHALKINHKELKNQVLRIRDSSDPGDQEARHLTAVEGGQAQEEEEEQQS